MWAVIVLIIGILIIAIPFAMSQAETNKNNREIQSTAQNNYIAENNITRTAEYKYENIIRDKCVRFIADDENKKIYISDTSMDFIKYSYSEIIGCELITDNQVTGGIKRAVVGGLIAGEAGAIVGAATAKNHIMSYKIVFYFNNVGNPKQEIVLINTKVTTKNSDYINAVKFAESVNATIKAILSQE